MNLTDPIADLLTRIRNAQQARHKTTRIPGSKMSLAVVNVLSKSGYVGPVSVTQEGHHSWIEVELKYMGSGEPVILGLRRESTPGQRRYVKKSDIPEVLNGLGIAILSTSHGVMTGQEAKETSTGGELLATVW